MKKLIKQCRDTIQQAKKDKRPSLALQRDLLARRIADVSELASNAAVQKIAEDIAGCKKWNDIDLYCHRLINECKREDSGVNYNRTVTAMNKRDRAQGLLTAVTKTHAHTPQDAVMLQRPDGRWLAYGAVNVIWVSAPQAHIFASGTAGKLAASKMAKLGHKLTAHNAWTIQQAITEVCAEEMAAAQAVINSYTA